MARSKKAQRLEEADIILRRLRSWSGGGSRTCESYGYDYGSYGYAYDYRIRPYRYGYRFSPYAYDYQSYAYDYSYAYAVAASRDQTLTLRPGGRVRIEPEVPGRHVLTVTILPSGEVEVSASRASRKGKKRKKGKRKKHGKGRK